MSSPDDDNMPPPVANTGQQPALELNGNQPTLDLQSMSGSGGGVNPALYDAENNIVSPMLIQQPNAFRLDEAGSPMYPGRNGATYRCSLQEGSLGVSQELSGSVFSPHQTPPKPFVPLGAEEKTAAEEQEILLQKQRAENLEKAASSEEKKE